MLETEKEVGWETALKIDNAVWIRLMEIVLRRIKKYLKIETNDISDLIEILSFRWSIEGWKYITRQISESEVYIEIIECPYKDIMDRNTERQDRIPLICKNMCDHIYKALVRDFNPRIKLERKEFMGSGDNVCDFCFKLI